MQASPQNPAEARSLTKILNELIDKPSDVFFLSHWIAVLEKDNRYREFGIFLILMTVFLYFVGREGEAV